MLTLSKLPILHYSIPLILTRISHQHGFSPLSSSSDQLARYHIRIRPPLRHRSRHLPLQPARPSRTRDATLRMPSSLRYVLPFSSARPHAILLHSKVTSKLSPQPQTGTAVTLSRGASPCTDVAFLIDYTDCLACADASIQNVWRYYGATLTVAGEKCGLSTTPVVAVSY